MRGIIGGIEEKGSGYTVKAVILAGGEGQRLQPVSVGTPKALLPLLGRPVVEHTNKAGAANLQMNPYLQALLQIHTQALAHERELGLTPAALRKLTDSVGEKPKKSALEMALEKLGGGLLGFLRLHRGGVAHFAGQGCGLPGRSWFPRRMFLRRRCSWQQN